MESNQLTALVDQVSRLVVQRLAEVAGEDERPVEVRVCTAFAEMKVPIGISVRHVHLCPEHVEILFGKGHNLVVYQDLYQKGYYAAKEQVMVVGRRRCMEGVRVLGPTRANSQVELSQTDALQIGLKLPIATEGTDPTTAPILLVGPEGTVALPGGSGGGAFVARRHMHMDAAVAAHYGIKNGDLLDLRIDGPRPTTLHGILVRTKVGWSTEVHLDTDEGNAAGIRSGQTGTLLIPLRE